VWGFPIVAAGIPFVVDHRWELDRLNPDSIGLDEVNRRLQKEKKGNS
jgi:hypothetical protein